MPHADPAVRSAYLKAWKKKNADKVAVYREREKPKRKAWDSARYWRDADKHRQRQCDYYAKNRDVVKAKQRDYVTRNHEQVLFSMREYYRNNRDEFMARNALRRALLLNAGVGTDREAYLQLVKSIRYAKQIRCYWCRRLVPKHLRHIDHVVPLSRGGRDDTHNICCACRSCNCRKGNKLPEEFSGQFVIPFVH